MAPAIFSLTAFIVLNEVRRNAVVQSSEGVRGGKGGGGREIKVIYILSTIKTQMNIVFLLSLYRLGFQGAATHLVTNPFDPLTSGPRLPVPLDKRSP